MWEDILQVFMKGIRSKGNAFAQHPTKMKRERYHVMEKTENFENQVIQGNIEEELQSAAPTIVDLTAEQASDSDYREEKEEDVIRPILAQIDALKAKAVEWQNIIKSKDAKNEQIKKLELQVEKLSQFEEKLDLLLQKKEEESAAKLDEKFSEQQELISKKIAYQMGQISDKFGGLSQEMEENFESFTQEMEEKLDTQSEKSEEVLKLLAEQLDTFKIEINDQIHKENVKCYRNIQGLIEEENKKEKDNSFILKENKKIKGYLKAILIFLILNFGVLVGYAFLTLSGLSLNFNFYS